MTSLRQQSQQQPQGCVAPPWLSTLLSNRHSCYCTSREGTGIFLVRGAGTSALTGTIPNPLCTVRRGAAQWGCPPAPSESCFVEHLGQCLLQRGLVPWFAVPEEGGCGFGVSIHGKA